LWLRQARDISPAERVLVLDDDTIRTVATVTSSVDGVEIRFTDGASRTFHPQDAVNIDGMRCDHCGTTCDPTGWCPEYDFHD